MHLKRLYDSVKIFWYNACQNLKRSEYSIIASFSINNPFFQNKTLHPRNLSVSNNFICFWDNKKFQQVTIDHIYSSIRILIIHMAHITHSTTAILPKSEETVSNKNRGLICLTTLSIRNPDAKYKKKLLFNY